MNPRHPAPFPMATMSTPPSLLASILTLVLLLVASSPLGASEQANREALRFNDAVTKLLQTRDDALAGHKAKSIAALTVLAKSRTKAEDMAGATEAWRAILSIDREHTDARAFFTQQGTLDAVLAELATRPIDLLGLDTGDASTKDDTKETAR